MLIYVVIVYNKKYVVMLDTETELLITKIVDFVNNIIEKDGIYSGCNIEGIFYNLFMTYNNVYPVHFNDIAIYKEKINLNNLNVIKNKSKYEYTENDIAFSNETLTELLYKITNTYKEETSKLSSFDIMIDKIFQDYSINEDIKSTSKILINEISKFHDHMTERDVRNVILDNIDTISALKPYQARIVNELFSLRSKIKIPLLIINHVFIFLLLSIEVGFWDTKKENFFEKIIALLNNRAIIDYNELNDLYKLYNETYSAVYKLKTYESNLEDLFPSEFDKRSENILKCILGNYSDIQKNSLMIQDISNSFKIITNLVNKAYSAYNEYIQYFNITEYNRNFVSEYLNLSIDLDISEFKENILNKKMNSIHGAYDVIKDGKKLIELFNNLNSKEVFSIYSNTTKKMQKSFVHYCKSNLSVIYNNKNVLKQYLINEVMNNSLEFGSHLQSMDPDDKSVNNVIQYVKKTLHSYLSDNQEYYAKFVQDLSNILESSKKYDISWSDPTIISMCLWFNISSYVKPLSDLEKSSKKKPPKEVDPNKTLMFIKTNIVNPSPNVIFITPAIEELLKNNVQLLHDIAKMNLTESSFLSKCKNINKLEELGDQINYIVDDEEKEKENKSDIQNMIFRNNLDIDTQKFKSFVNICCNEKISYVFYQANQDIWGIKRFADKININYQELYDKYLSYREAWDSFNISGVGDDVVANNKLASVLTAHQVINQLDEPENKKPELFELNVKVNDFSFETLPDKSYKHFTVGVDTDCCQIIGGFGNKAVIDSYMNPLAGVLVLKTNNDIIISQSYFHYVPEGKEGKGFILDNVETNSALVKKLKINLNDYYSYLAKYIKEKYKVDFFSCGLNYNKLDSNAFEKGKMEDDPRSFYVNSPYSDFDERKFLNLLAPKFTTEKQESKTASHIRRNILKEIYANIISAKYE